MSNVRINLLPHRELRRAARKREFIFVAAGTVIFAIATALLVHTIRSACSNRSSRRTSS